MGGSRFLVLSWSLLPCYIARGNGLGWRGFWRTPFPFLCPLSPRECCPSWTESLLSISRLLCNATSIAKTYKPPTLRCVSKRGSDLVGVTFRISTCTSCVKHACTSSMVSLVWSGWWSLFRPRLLYFLSRGHQPSQGGEQEQCIALQTRLDPDFGARPCSQDQQRRMDVTQILQEELLRFCQLHRDLVGLRLSFWFSHLNCETAGVCWCAGGLQCVS